MKENFKKKSIIFFLLLVLLILSTILYGFFLGPKGLVVKEHMIVDKNLPASFYGMKIVHFSDLHYGNTINEIELKKIVKQINLTKPDIVIFTGDLIDKNTILDDNIKKLIIMNLKNINSKYGKYYVSGNHDSKFSSFDIIMGKSDFKSLNNDFDTIYSEKYEEIFISGINTNSIDLKPINEYIKEFNPKFKILLMHMPDNIKLTKDYNYVFAGHSHNKQVNIPFIKNFIKINGAEKYYDEYYKVNNTNLYISSGLGTSVFDIRLFNKPSFNLYRIVNK